MIDFFGHLAYAILIFGMWLISKRLIVGWAVHAFGTTMWLVLGFAMSVSSIWFWSAVFIVMDAVGFYRWKHEKTN